MTTTTVEDVLVLAVDIVEHSCEPTFTDLDIEQLRTHQAAVFGGVADADEAVSLAKWADSVAATLACISRKLTAHMPAQPGSIRHSSPLSEGSLKVYRVMSEAMGGQYPVEQVAEMLGIDLDTATEADAWALSKFYAARLGDKH